jgi:alanine racemase
MDFLMVDVTDIPAAELGSRVTLIGSDGGESITIESLSALGGCFHYEVACGFGKRLPRVYE